MVAQTHNAALAALQAHDRAGAASKADEDRQAKALRVRTARATEKASNRERLVKSRMVVAMVDGLAELPHDAVPDVLARWEREAAAGAEALAVLRERHDARRAATMAERQCLVAGVVREVQHAGEATLAAIRQALVTAVRPLLVDLVRHDAIEARACGGLPVTEDDELIGRLFSGRIVGQKLVEGLPKLIGADGLDFTEIVREATEDVAKIMGAKT